MQDTAVYTFDDVLAANRDYARDFAFGHVPAPAARGLALLTCMDSRLDPLRALGLTIGDFKMLRNAGGRLTDDMRSDLVLASHLLGVHRVLVMPHTRCAMSSGTDEDVAERIRTGSGIDPGSRRWHTIADQRARLDRDVVALRADPHLHPDVVVGGAVYDVDTGLIELVIPPA